MCGKCVRTRKVTVIPRYMRLSDSPLCRRCGRGDEASTHILCECEALASPIHAYLGSFLEPEDIKRISGGYLELWQSNRAPLN